MSAVGLQLCRAQDARFAPAERALKAANVLAAVHDVIAPIVEVDENRRIAESSAQWHEAHDIAKVIMD